MTPTYSAKDIFQSVLERYDENPKIHSEFLRRLAATEPKTFVQLAREALLERDFNRGLEVVGHLLASTAFLGSLLAHYAESRDEAIALATKLQICDPKLDSALLTYAEQARAAGQPVGKTVLPALDIVDVISVGVCLIPRMFRFLKDPNPSVRSKAGIFVFRRTQNLTWIVNRFPSTDPRIKANALEALYQFRSDDAAALFKAALPDPNNRVAANALLGLYLFGDTTSIPLVYSMASNPEEEFRASSAWVMGKTDDPRFIDILTTLAEDESEMVRKRALQTLRQVSKTLDTAMCEGGLRLSVVKTQKSGDTASVTAIVRDAAQAAVAEIPGTRFLLRVDGRAITEYTFAERSCPNSVDVAFACIRNSANDDLMTETTVTGAIKHCLPLRRKHDMWAVVRTSSVEKRAVTLKRSYIDVWNEPEPVSQAAESHAPFTVEFSTIPSRVGRSIDKENVPVHLPPEKLFTKVVEDVIAASRQSEERHLILFGSCGAEGLLDDDLRGAILRHGMRVHIIDSRRTAPAPGIGDAARLTGGSYHSVGPDEVAQTCYDVYCSILHQYQITWMGEVGEIELQALSEGKYGRTSTVRAAAQQPVLKAG